MMVWKAEHWLAEHWLAAIVVVTVAVFVGVAINVPRPTFAPPVANASVASPAADTSSLTDAQAALARMQERAETETLSARSEVVAVGKTFLEAWWTGNHGTAIRQCTAEAADNYRMAGDASANNFVTDEYSPWRSGMKPRLMFRSDITLNGDTAKMRYYIESSEWETGRYVYKRIVDRNLVLYKTGGQWKVVKSEKL